jgi:hypothetical protein
MTVIAVPANIIIAGIAAINIILFPLSLVSPQGTMHFRVVNHGNSAALSGQPCRTQLSNALALPAIEAAESAGMAIGMHAANRVVLTV